MTGPESEWAPIIDAAEVREQALAAVSAEALDVLPLGAAGDLHAVHAAAGRHSPNGGSPKVERGKVDVDDGRA